MTGPDPHFVVLIVDDSPSDRRMATDALADAGFPADIHYAADGAEALAFLRDPAMPRPHLVLLDLRMAGMEGTEFLEMVHADPELRGLNVIVQTTSESDVDNVKVWELGARHFVRKPLTGDALGAVLRGEDAEQDGSSAVSW